MDTQNRYRKPFEAPFGCRGKRLGEREFFLQKSAITGPQGRCIDPSIFSTLTQKEKTKLSFGFLAAKQMAREIRNDKRWKSKSRLTWCRGRTLFLIWLLGFRRSFEEPKHARKQPIAVTLILLLDWRFFFSSTQWWSRFLDLKGSSSREREEERRILERDEKGGEERGNSGVREWWVWISRVFVWLKKGKWPLEMWAYFEKKKKENNGILIKKKGIRTVRVWAHRPSDCFVGFGILFAVGLKLGALKELGLWLTDLFSLGLNPRVRSSIRADRIAVGPFVGI